MGHTCLHQKRAVVVAAVAAEGAVVAFHVQKVD
jgi:hypothetical protein